VLCPPGAFEARPRVAQGDLPPVPLAVRRAEQVAPAAAARATPRVRATWGGNRVIAPPLAESNPGARTGPRPAGRLDGVAAPSRAPGAMRLG
jgi:hypothetical protein